MNKYFLAFVLFVSCTNVPKDREEYLISKDAVGYIELGMTTAELRERYSNYKFGKMYNFEFDLDDEEEGLLLIDNSDTLAFIWLKYGTDRIGGISCLSEKYKTKTGIHVGMTISDVEKIHSDIKVSPSMYDSSIEYILIEEENIALVFVSHSENSVGTYENESSLHYGSTVYDSRRRIDRINLR